MKTLTCILVCLFSVTCFGQTKLVSHRSHSGSDANFRTAIEKDLFDIGNSNFGLVVKYTDKIDTVILKGKNQIIVVKKRYRIINGKPDKTISARDTLTKANAADFFKANSMDGLKAEIHKMYKTAKLDSILFIGFNKKFKQKKT